MLRLGDSAFVSGRSRFFDQIPGKPEPTAKIYVKIQFPGFKELHVAQLDTGAAWSVLDPELASSLGILDLEGEPNLRLQTRFGIYTGKLIRLPFSLVADEGESLEAEGAFFVSPDWPEGLSFLGYSGLLDSIRFALDPQANHFYFGPC